MKCKGSVSAEIRDTASLLNGICRPGIETVVVKSNHDDALDRWVRADAGSKDELNVTLHSYLRYRQADAIEQGLVWDHFEGSLRKHALHEGAVYPERLIDYEIEFPAGPIEFSLHGDKGEGGARGSPMGFVRADPKIIAAHSHTPYRREGYGCVGTSTKADMTSGAAATFTRESAASGSLAFGIGRRPSSAL